MTKEQIIKDILERMEDKGIAIENLSFDGDYKIKVNELEIHITYSGDQATIFYDGGSKRIGFIEDLAQEVVALLPVEEWEEGQEVIGEEGRRILVTSSLDDDKFNLLDDDIYKLQYQYAYTTSELKMLGWERV